MLNQLIILAIVLILCGVLGALGGAKGFSKAYRRLGIPTALIAFLWASLGYWALLYILLLFPLSLGYGRYDPNDSKPSSIGLWVHEHLGLGVSNGVAQDWEDCIIRSIIGLVYGLVLLPVAFVSQNWLFYSIFCVFFSIFSINYESFGQNIPDLRIKGKVFLSEEFIRYAILGGMAYLIGA